MNNTGTHPFSVTCKSNYSFIKLDLTSLFLFFQGVLSSSRMMKVAQFNISARDKCVWAHHCSCRRSKGQAQCSGAWATTGTTSTLIILRRSSKVCRGHLHTKNPFGKASQGPNTLSWIGIDNLKA